MKKAFIRADSSVQIGSGHIMRCLTLAGDLTNAGLEVFFITRDLPGNLVAHIQSQGYPALVLPALLKPAGVEDIQWLSRHWAEDAQATAMLIRRHQQDDQRADILLVVDHYAFDSRWERMLRPIVQGIRVIDDLANRPHECDSLLDQNFYQDMPGRYRGLTPPGCRLWLGPKYALLRPEFRKARHAIRPRDGKVRHLLLFFGGSDPTGETFKALEALTVPGLSDLTADVVTGLANPRREMLRRVVQGLPNLTYHCQVDYMAGLMTRADLAVGAGGTTTLERSFLGLPSVVVAVADNQVESAEALAATGAIAYAGWHETVTAASLAEAIAGLRRDPRRMIAMSRRSLELFE